MDFATAILRGALAGSLKPILSGAVPGKMGLDKVAGEFDSRGTKMAQEVAARKAKIYDDKTKEYNEQTQNVKKKIADTEKAAKERDKIKALEAKAKATGMYK